MIGVESRGSDGFTRGMSYQFLREFLRAPLNVGAIWPSSPALARRIVDSARVREAARVVELGPGSGAFTGTILSSLKPDAKFLAIEKSEALADEVARRFPSARVRHGCATELSAHLREEDFGSPESVVSGLPWAVFPDGLQRTILGELRSTLAPGATFSTFAYFGPHNLPSGRKFRSVLHETFSSVRRTPVVLANFPPAFVYVCTR